MADAAKYNMKNPAVKRILQEVKEMQKEPSDEYMSVPLEDNIFEWHFAIRGPRDSEFEGGIYHGRIILPHEYPFKPPSFMLLTPNGRFEVQTKICLSISQHHPEHWQPSWSVRTALVALIAFMPTKPDGALGSLDHTKEERRALAIKSRLAPPKFGSAERQKVIDQVHEQMLREAPPVPELSSTPETAPDTPEPEEAHPEPNSTPPAPQPEAVEPRTEAAEAGTAGTSSPAPLPPPGPSSPTTWIHGVDEATSVTPDVSDGLRQRPAAIAAESSQRLPYNADQAQPHQHVSPRPITAPRPPSGLVAQQGDDRWLTMLAVGLAVAIIALLVRKFLRVYYGPDA